jgi:hypothetical protein
MYSSSSTKHAPSPYSPQHIAYSPPPPHGLQQWAHHATEPQELPAEITPASYRHSVDTTRYSELSAAPPTSHQPQQYAELSAVKTARCSIEEIEGARGLGVETAEPVLVSK